MVNIFLTFIAQLFEFVSVILSLPGALLADISRFFYMVSGIGNNNNEEDENE